MRRHSQPVDDTQKQKFKGIAKRLEEGLFKAAQTKVFLLIHLILIYVCIWMLFLCPHNKSLMEILFYSAFSKKGDRLIAEIMLTTLKD
jgi:hypothetical protein